MIPVPPTEPKITPKKSTRVTAASSTPERRRRICIKNAKPMGPKSPTVSASADLSPQNPGNNISRSPSAPEFDEESEGMGVATANSEGSIALLTEKIQTLEERLEVLAKKSDECAVWTHAYHQVNRKYRSLQTEIAEQEQVIQSLRRELAHSHGKVAQPK
ncbi:hypothetical protein H072_6249 [Dactylellina haptotyla CBS 200.50]|uniref:Uncharacterized protein n=1 Tax=Dactylellina haptotyla (strain CBS 200.50) TaxID=1284197 RepID=S8AFK3_DACHA|nr:hypothetical protein H072_6249 [Dactylellina haptotyla CBS 200.50]